MSLSTLPQAQVKKWHVIVFASVAGLLALLLFYGGIGDLLLLPGQSGFPSIIHRWHEAQSGVLLVILLGGCLLGLLWQPQHRPLLAQFILMSIAIAILAFATVSGAGFNPIFLGIGAVLIAILVAAYPAPRTLLHIRRDSSLSYPLLAISLVAAVVLAPNVARELNFQILGMTEHDVHALNYHWLTSVILTLLIILAGSLSATKSPGWKVLACVTGIAFLYLGSIGILLPGYAGSWGMIGGILGLICGLAYITATFLEAYKGRRVTRIETANLMRS